MPSSRRSNAARGGDNRRAGQRACRTGHEAVVVRYDSAGADDSRVSGFRQRSGPASLAPRQVQAIDFSPDGRYLASCSADGVIKLWDVDSGTLRNRLIGHTQRVNDVAFTADGTRLISASWDRTVIVWDVSTARQIGTLRGHTSSINSATRAGSHATRIAGPHSICATRPEPVSMFR